MAHRKTCDSKNEWFAREAFFNSSTAEHCHRDKTKDKTAGCSKKRAETAAHAGINRNTDCTEYDVKRSGCTA